ncbi:TnsD family Tn7-like transposition protein [Robertmurraya sp. P23]|uniref:TnsD family Tn7-like transposition protein n=1 Tax=Robertmurraya sp. P23 TaxID=3436931 RepID=UPI003D9529A4
MNKLLLFPEPYPDEDFRSVLFRYHIRTPNTSFQESNIELFGKKSIKNLMFPNRLEELFRRLPVGHTIKLEDIIYKHTWYGLIERFISKEKHLEYLNSFKYGTDNHFWMMNSNFDRIFSNKIKYCPICIKDDFKNYGECFVHKIHQIEFLDFCPHHFAKLINECNVCAESLSKAYDSELIRTPFCRNGHYLCDQVMEVENEDKIIKFKYELINILCSIRDKRTLVDHKVYLKIIMALWKMGFIHYKGRINKEELIASITSKYSEKALEHINLPYDYISHRWFLGRVIKQDLKGDLLFYCLLILFLFKTVENMIDFNEPIANHVPFNFNNGPWKCHNSICDYFNKNIINNCKKIAKVSGGIHITGEFSCPYCGYTYTKRWRPNQTAKEKVMIKSMGYLWINKVLEMYSTGMSANEIARKLGCSDTTVRSNLKRIVGITNMLISSEQQEAVKEIINGYLETAGSKDLSMEKIIACRSIIEDLLINRKVRSRMDLIKIAPKEYNWIQRYDGDWLDTIIPQKKGGKKRCNIDYSSFDLELAAKIESVVKDLYENYSYRIHKNTILKKLNSTEASRINSMQNDLPRSIHVLNNHIESRSEYLIRSLPKEKTKLINIGYKKVDFNTLKRFSKRYQKCDQVTEDKIIEILNN